MQKLPAPATARPPMLAPHAARPATATEQILNTLGPQIARSLHFETADAENCEGGYTVTGCTLRRNFPVPELVAAVGALDQACMPAPDDRLVQAITELRVITRGVRLEEDDLALSTAALAARMLRYPGVIVLEVLRSWGDAEPWFPAWADIKSRLDIRMAKILAARFELEREIAWQRLIEETDGSDAEIRKRASETADQLEECRDWFGARWLRHRLDRRELAQRRMREAELQQLSTACGCEVKRIIGGGLRLVFDDYSTDADTTEEAIRHLRTRAGRLPA